jgi:hypothetical protein
MSAGCDNVEPAAVAAAEGPDDRYRNLRKLGADMGLTPDAVDAALNRADAARNANRRAQHEGRTIDWPAWKGKTPPARQWLVQDWLSADPTLFSGVGGIGKSLIAQTIGTALATGREFLATPAQPVRVLMWACEDDEDELVRRQFSICRYFGIELDAIHGRLFVEPRRGCENTLMELEYGKPVFTTEYFRLLEQINDLGIDVFIADNNGQMYGGNENDRHQVTRYVNGLQGLVRGRPFTAMPVGHVSRSAGSEFSGNAAWENACRMRWFIDYWLPGQKPKDAPDPAPSDPIYLCKRKTNYSERDYRRFYFRNGLFVPETYRSAGPAAASARMELAEAIVLKGLPRIGTMGLHSSNAPTSTNYLPKQLMAHKLNEDHTLSELAGAMRRLMTAGRLKMGVVGKRQNRMDREGLVIAGDAWRPPAEPEEDVPF